MLNKTAILKKYNELCAASSDINQLLPYLNTYAKQCSHITEMGIRTPTSTYAFLAAAPHTLIGYDIHRTPEVDEAEALAPGVFEFILQDVLKADIAETDFLFIDTYHTAAQLENELAKHASKVRRYIGFHDTATFWETGEEPYPGMDTEMACGRGLKHAIIPFLYKGGWKIAIMTDISNGLLILERTSGIIGQLPLFNYLKFNLYFNLRKLNRRYANLKHKLKV